MFQDMHQKCCVYNINDNSLSHSGKFFREKPFMNFAVFENHPGHMLRRAAPIGLAREYFVNLFSMKCSFLTDLCKFSPSNVSHYNTVCSYCSL